MHVDSDYFKVNLKRLPLWKWWFGLLLFVAAQTAGTIHAEIHAFHEHTVTCEAFENAADPTFNTPEFLWQTPMSLAIAFPPAGKLPAGALQTFDAFLSRAPPRA